MKNINKILGLGMMTLALTGCKDLDTTYEGGFVTTEQKEAVLRLNPDMAQAGVMGLSSGMSQFMTVYENHFDFGYPGVMIGLDMQTQDYLTTTSGYNWFNFWFRFTSPTPSGTPAGMAWYHIYKDVLNANTVASTIDPATEDGTLKFYRAQAVGKRAFDYLTLAQLFQFNYSIDPSAPGVPLVTNENSAEVEQNGAPRASLEEMYAQILKDAGEAISLLSSTNVTPETVLDSKPKRMISLAVAYGIRARAYMAMHKYAEAAQDAQAAINSFSGRPYSIAEMSRPSFTNIDDPAWMWGIAIAETDRVVTSGIVNFPSMTCTFCSSGYVTVGAWKYASDVLYKQIPSADVRKGWFLDENMTSTHLNRQEQAYIDSYDNMPAYTNVKYAGYQNVVGQSTNASDIPLMRIEEMYYILAEGQAMSGNTAGAKSTFESFIRTYRNPNFVMNAETAEDMQNVIYNDKRVEFWGEGILYFDLMRLDKGVDRRPATNVEASAYIYIPSYKDDDTGTSWKDKRKAGVLIYCIPTGEINGNKALTQADNNLSCDAPVPVH